MNAVARQVQRGQGHYRGPSAQAQTSSLTQRQVRNPSGSSVRDSGAPRAQPRPTELTIDRSTQSPARSTHVRESSVGRKSQQRRYVQFGERSPTYGRPENHRVGEVRTRSPSPTDCGDGREHYGSLFEVCMIQQLFVFSV